MSLLSRRSKKGEAAAHGSGLGVLRYPVERTLAWVGTRRRLKFSYERWAQHFQAFHDLAMIDINFKRLYAVDAKTEF